MNRRNWLALASVALSGLAFAQDPPYPAKPVRVIVGYATGGGTDIIARLIAPSLSEELGQTVFVENRPGASGTIGATLTAKAPPDGYTLMMGVVSLNAVQPSLQPNLPYDTEKDFVPITLVASVPHFIAVHPSLPVHSLKELVAHAKANPGKLSYPSAGNGTTPHLAGEMFKHRTGAEMLHVPYKSSGQSMPDLLAGLHHVSLDTYATLAPYIASGKLRALAVTGDKRLPDFPNVPTVAEAGVPDYRISTWYGLFAPRGTPPAVVQLVHAKAAKAMARADTRRRLKEAGADETVTQSPEEFARLVRSDTERFARIVRDAGIRID